MNDTSDTVPGLSGWPKRLLSDSTLKVTALRGFKRHWFLPALDTQKNPNPHHIRLVNERIQRLRRTLEGDQKRIELLVKKGNTGDIRTQLQFARQRLEQNLYQAQLFWDFFFDMFSQRRSIYGNFLGKCDRVVGESYINVFKRLGQPLPWIQTPPLCYLEKSLGAATTRRGVLSLGGKRSPVPNPFHLIKMPYPNMFTPWRLTSLFHEVSHNIHGDIPNFWNKTKKEIHRVLLKKGFPKQVARVYSHWHKETFADLFAILIGGPAVVLSLMDLLTRPRSRVMRFRSRDSHPTPYLRVFMSTYALKGLGFSKDAKNIEQQWKKLYPLSGSHAIPKIMLQTAKQAIPVVVQTLLKTQFPELKGKRVIDLIRYTQRSHRRMLAAAKNLTSGKQPVGLSKRLVISAGVYAFHLKPEKALIIRKAIYRTLGVRHGTRPSGVIRSSRSKTRRPIIVKHRDAVRVKLLKKKRLRGRSFRRKRLFPRFVLVPSLIRTPFRRKTKKVRTFTRSRPTQKMAARFTKATKKVLGRQIPKKSMKIPGTIRRITAVNRRRPASLKLRGRRLRLVM